MPLVISAVDVVDESCDRPRKSLGMSPANSKTVKDVIVPEVLMNVLRQQSEDMFFLLLAVDSCRYRLVWLLRDQNDEQFNSLLQRFVSLPRSSLAKAQENSLLAKLNLHNVYLRFRGDMFLNSLAESRKTTLLYPLLNHFWKTDF
jgi:separase